ncbi:MAG: hypothetical protein KBT06_03955 [Prevotellaceae bacterium]|nr:hypothetical protein [Candidatus Colivivens equi]
MISCGEDRTYEYEEFTIKNRVMQELLQKYYLWGDSIKDLTWKEYFGDVNTCFQKMISQAPVEDKWSYCAIDSVEQDYHERGYFNHIHSYGLDVMTMNDPTRLTNQTYARILTVYPNSSAAECGLKRGDFIGYINGEKLTAKNAELLKNGEALSLVVYHMLLIRDSIIWEKVDTIQMNKATRVDDVQVPVVRHFIKNNKSVSYMMVNSLKDDGFKYDCANINSADIFVLDLRLCNDGTIDNACALASCIVPTECIGEIFAKTLWNRSNTQYNKDYTYDAEYQKYHLDVDSLVIITGKYTQSASEWLINGLKNTMRDRVKVIGVKTVGQNVLLSDIPTTYGYTLHPAVAFVADANGQYNYENGVCPDIEIDEYMYHPLYEYGDEREVILNSILR